MIPTPFLNIIILVCLLLAQWIDVLRNNSFLNSTRLPLLCRNSRAVALAQLGLMAGWLADEMHVNFNFLKFIVDQNFELFAAFNTVTALLEQYECI